MGRMAKTSRIERLYWLFGWAYDFSRVATILLLVALAVNYFFFSVMVVRGKSMVPTYVDGNVQLVNRIVYALHPPQRGDVVALNFPGEPNQRFVKRIIGLPGETVAVSGGKVYVNNQPLAEKYLPSGLQSLPDLTRTLVSNEYFVMGDNRPVSSDSRSWGPVPKSFLIGKVATRLLSLPTSGKP